MSLIYDRNETKKPTITDYKIILAESIQNFRNIFKTNIMLEFKNQSQIILTSLESATVQGIYKNDTVFTVIDKDFPVIISFDYEPNIMELDIIGKYLYQNIILIVNKNINQKIKPYLNLIYDNYNYHENDTGEFFLIYPTHKKISDIFKNSTTVATKTILKTDNIKKELGYCFLADLSLYTKLADSNNNNLISRLRLYENGVELHEAHSQHQDIRLIGNGKFSFWCGTLYFSSSDNSDPLTNNKIYSFNFKIKKVFLIGTCRIHLTLSPTNNITCYPNDNVIIYSYKMGYPHYTKEIIHFLDMLETDFVDCHQQNKKFLRDDSSPTFIPEEIAKHHVFNGVSCKNFALIEFIEILRECEIIMIEVSSMSKIPTEINNRTYYLNLVKNKLFPIVVMDNKETMSDIEIIYNKLIDNKILFVTHNYNVNPKRQNLISLIEQMSEKLNINIFRPHDYIKNETERYMPDGLHFSLEGLVLIKNAMIDKIKTMH